MYRRSNKLLSLYFQIKWIVRALIFFIFDTVPSLHLFPKSFINDTAPIITYNILTLPIIQLPSYGR
jgi:hypothetical protein